MSKQRDRDDTDTGSRSLRCGIVMPISGNEGGTADHWQEVLQIFKDAVLSIERHSFMPELVSQRDDVGVIHKTIINNLYYCDIVVCDVSCMNPNVMFELGMRLAFDKPVVIVKDNITTYSFDTANIEHLEYPRDLRFSSIIQFKERLASKVLATYLASIEPDYSSFLKDFGSFKVAGLQEKEGSAEEYLLKRFDDMERKLESMLRGSQRSRPSLAMFTDSSGKGIYEVPLDRNGDLSPDILKYIEAVARKRGISVFQLIDNDDFYKEIKTKFCLDLIYEDDYLKSLLKTAYNLK